MNPEVKQSDLAKAASSVVIVYLAKAAAVVGPAIGLPVDMALGLLVAIAHAGKSFLKRKLKWSWL